MKKLGSDSDGATDTSLSAIKLWRDMGKNLSRIEIRSKDVGCFCKFVFTDETYYTASGFSIGYSGSGPHGLWEAIKLFYVNFGHFDESKIATLDSKSNYNWNPDSRFRQVGRKKVDNIDMGPDVQYH